MVPEMMMLIGLIMLVVGIHKALKPRPGPEPEPPRMLEDWEIDELLRPVGEWVAEGEMVAIREYEFRHRVDLSHLYM